MQGKLWLILSICNVLSDLFQAYARYTLAYSKPMQVHSGGLFQAYARYTLAYSKPMQGTLFFQAYAWYTLAHLRFPLSPSRSIHPRSPSGPPPSKFLSDIYYPAAPGKRVV